MLGWDTVALLQLDERTMTVLDGQESAGWGHGTGYGNDVGRELRRQMGKRDGAGWVGESWMEIRLRRWMVEKERESWTGTLLQCY